MAVEVEVEERGIMSHTICILLHCRLRGWLMITPGQEETFKFGCVDARAHSCVCVTVSGFGAVYSAEFTDVLCFVAVCLGMPSPLRTQLCSSLMLRTLDLP